MAKSPSTFDLVVIGAGAAGSSVASGAAERGYAVALIEEWAVGGTCLNAGCDPTKTLLRSAEIAHLARTSGRFGIHTGNVRVDWPAIRQRVHAVIDAIRGGDGDQNIRDLGITLIKEHGRFIDRDHVVAGDHTLSADRFLIATGARSRVDGIDGIANVGFLTHRDVPDLESLPESMVIVGAGAEGVEFAQIFTRLGVDVTLVDSHSQLLPREEPTLAEALRNVLVSEGVTWVPNVRVTSATTASGRKRLTGEGPGRQKIQLEAEAILLTAGRVPNLEHLGLASAGVTTGSRGVMVDATLRTTNPLVYAAGDVTGIYPFTHVADYQARIVEHNLLADAAPHKTDYRVVPWVIYTDPELARVGLTEAEAKAGGYAVVTATVRFADIPRAMTQDDPHGMVRLVVDRYHRRVLGGHILGARAGELISEIAVVMERELSVDALVATIHPYPTMSEAIFWAAYQVVNDGLDGSPANG